jgi:nitrogen fixation protein FixH
MTSRRPTTITGRHVLIALLAMFGVVILVNGVFAYFALSSHPGVVTEDSYAKGLRYNAALAAAAAQRDLGWRSEINFAPEGRRGGMLEVRIVDAAGVRVRDLDVAASIRRPVVSGHDQAVMLARAADGAYRAKIVLPLSGNWDVEINAERAGRHVFRLEHRLWLD